MAPTAGGDSSTSVENPVVLLTGYGLFRDYTSNSSQEVVERIAELGIEGINLETEIFPVQYAYVRQRTQELYEKLKPRLIVHCGMYSGADAVVMEQMARNSGYEVADAKGDMPGPCCVEATTASPFLTTGLDLETIATTCKAPIPVYISRDAGLYLCEYVYYCALHNCDKALFIHVPSVSEEMPLEKLVETVKRIIVLALQQCKECSG